MRPIGGSLLVLMIGLSGCFKAQSSFERELERWEMRLDKDWRRWSTTAQLEDTMKRVEGAPEAVREHPRILWRRARLDVARAWTAVDPANKRHALVHARALSVRCIQGQATGRGRRRVQPLVQAIGNARDAKEACVVWGLHAWARWTRMVGQEVAALDGEILDAMVARLQGAKASPYRTDAAWSLGLDAVTRDVNGQSRQSSGRLLLAISTREAEVDNTSDQWVRYVDLHVLAEGGGKAVAEPSRPPKNDAERLAQARLTLGEGKEGGRPRRRPTRAPGSRGAGETPPSAETPSDQEAPPPTP